MYQCLEGGVIAVLQSYIDEDVRDFSSLFVEFEFVIVSRILRRHLVFRLLCRSER